MSTLALVRRPGSQLDDGIVDHIEKVSVDLDIAREQWRAYVDVLERHGWSTVEVEEADDCPDAVFVEDTVVMFRNVAVITLQRPDKLNALDAAMIAALHQAALAIDADPSLRVAILTGEGKAFCAGGDIKAWGTLDPLSMGQTWVRLGHRAF